MTQTNLILLAASPLIMWRVYKRVQRLTLRQTSRLWRHWFGVIFLPLALLAMIAMLLAKPAVLATLLGAATVGGVLGVVALRRMTFERLGSAYFYTPYAPIGMLVAMLFIARVLYRLFEMATLGAAGACIRQQPADDGDHGLRRRVLPGLRVGFAEVAPGGSTAANRRYGSEALIMRRPKTAPDADAGTKGTTARKAWFFARACR